MWVAKNIRGQFMLIRRFVKLILMKLASFTERFPVCCLIGRRVLALGADVVRVRAQACSSSHPARRTPRRGITGNRFDSLTGQKSP